MQEGGSHGIFLLHGFGDTPQTFYRLAPALAKIGYPVRAPLLPGHGRNAAAFKASRSEEWIAAARAELTAFTARHDRVSVVGLSMGGALAAMVAAGNEAVCAVVLVAPYLGMPRGLGVLARTHRVWGWLAGTVRSASGRSILDPEERSRNLGYGLITGRLLFELWRVVQQGRAALGGVTAPTLIIQSRGDSRIHPRVAASAFAALGSHEKRILWVDGAGHILTVDYGRDRVISEIASWIRAHDSGASAKGRDDAIASSR